MISLSFTVFDKDFVKAPALRSARHSKCYSTPTAFSMLTLDVRHARLIMGELSKTWPT